MIQGTSSRVPAVIDALVSLLRASGVLTGVQVLDGPVLSVDQVQADSICVAPSTEDQPGVTVTYDRVPNLGRTAYTETISIILAVSSYSGDTNMQTRRNRCQVLIEAIGDVLEANPTRAAAWDEIGWGGDASWYFVQGGNGATTAVGLLVEARSLV